MSLGNIGDRIMGVVGDFIILVIILALAVQLSPTAIEYIQNLGNQMATYTTGTSGSGTTNLVSVIGQILLDYGPVVWYGSLAGAAFAAIYDMVRRFFKG